MSTADMKLMRKCLKGSYTVEAAMVIPLCMAIFVVIILFIRTMTLANLLNAACYTSIEEAAEEIRAYSELGFWQGYESAEEGAIGIQESDLEELWKALNEELFDYEYLNEDYTGALGTRDKTTSLGCMALSLQDLRGGLHYNLREYEQFHVNNQEALTTLKDTYGELKKEDYVAILEYAFQEQMNTCLMSYLSTRISERMFSLEDVEYDNWELVKEGDCYQVSCDVSYEVSIPVLFFDLNVISETVHTVCYANSK